jgi:quinol monooxygenase YgiN
MLVIAGSVRIRADRRDAAVAAARAMIAATRREAGCVAYRFSFDLDDPDLVHLFEEWQSAEALAAHFASPHMAAFQGVLGDVLAGAPEIRRYDVASAGPLAV